MSFRNDRKRSAPGASPSGQKAFIKNSHLSQKNSKGQPGGKPRFFAGKPTGGTRYKQEKLVKEENDDKRRKRPITQGGGEQVAVVEDVDMSGDDGEGLAEVGGEEAPEKKPRLSKTEKAALHAAQPHRTALLPSHPLLQDKLLPLWEKARRADLGKEERKVAVKELWETAKGRVLEISRGHKGGRVLQTIVKHGGKEERLGVAMELQPQWREMMESKYSKFLMSKLIRYVPSLRPLLIPVIITHLQSLLSHAHAVGPLSDFFDLYASAKERRLLVRGFYPREVAIFHGGKGEEGLEGTLAAMGDGKGKERVLDGIEKTIVDVFNATQKTALTQGIFHRLVSEYLACIYRLLPVEDADKKMHELLTASLESLADIVHTKDGSVVVRELLVRGNAKDRKQILQHLRKHVEAICKDGDAQLVLFTAFDVVDDTKLMGKAFVSDIVSLAPTLMYDANGRRSILYMLVPTSKKHFLPSTLASLAASARQARNIGTSKKDPVVRRKELVEYASPGMLELVKDKGAEMVRDPGAGLIVQEIMLSAGGAKDVAVSSLVTPLRGPYPSPEVQSSEPSDHILDLSHAVRTYKTLLSGGPFDNATRQVTVIDPSLPPLAASAIWGAISSEEAGGEDNVKRVALGHATFVLVELIGALAEDGRGGEVKRVLGSSDILDQLRGSERKGAGLLAERLTAL